jgi:hypothetical protein
MIPGGGATYPSPGDLNGAWSFTRRDARRIARTVNRLEVQYYNGPAERARYPVITAGLVPAQLNGAIAGGTIAAPANAQATLLIQSSAGPGLTPGSDTITVQNVFSAGVTTGKTIWVIPQFGFWYLIQADC